MSTLPLQSLPAQLGRNLVLAQSASTPRTNRWLIAAPVLGMASAVALLLLPLAGFGTATAVYAAFCLGIASLYLALVPICEHGGKMALVMAIANASAALMLADWSVALHSWLSLQTVIAALWLLRDQHSGTRALAGLLLGLNAGAVAALGITLSG